jgi:hypothetical protein
LGSEGGGRRFLYLQKSQLIHEHPHRRVSLVKVNVERAEEDVLMGVETRHWPLIDQVGELSPDTPTLAPNKPIWG